MGLEAELVLHGWRTGDPEAEIEVGEVESSAEFDLLQDGVGANTHAPHARIEVGVDGRESVGCHVDQCDSNQASFVSVLDLEGIDTTLHEEFVVGGFVEQVIAEREISFELVAIVEGDLLGRRGRRTGGDVEECLSLPERPPLGTGGPEGRDRQSDCLAGPTSTAGRLVEQ